MESVILGLDIGGTKTAVIWGDRAGRVHRRAEFATAPQRGPDAVMAELVSRLLGLRECVVAEGNRIEAVSVAIGGPLEIERGVIHSPPNLPGWDQVPMKEMLESRTSLPVFIEHDGNAGTLAEWYFGAARGYRNIIFLTMGTGFGGGLILDGQLYRGTNDLAGEVGHVRLADDGPAAYGKPGSWEGFCGGAGITRLAAMRFPGRWGDGLAGPRELGELARAGDADAVAVLTEVGHRLGRGLALLVDVLNPEIIVIGSLAVRLGDLVLEPAREELAREALPASAAVCRIVPAALGESLGDVACLCAAIRALGGPTACHGLSD